MGTAKEWAHRWATENNTRAFMSCFYHHERDSVGGCKSCGKNLCPECAIDLGKGLACRGHCEEDVRALITLIDRNVKLSPQTARMLASSRKITSNAALFNVVTGVIFIAWGLADTERFSFILILGICFLVYGVFGILQTRRLARERDEK